MISSVLTSEPLHASGIPSVTTISFLPGVGTNPIGLLQVIFGNAGYTFNSGADFFPIKNSGGVQPTMAGEWDPFQAAQTLAAAINSDTNTKFGPQNIGLQLPIKPFYAVVFGTTVYVIAKIPGPLGARLINCTLGGSNQAAVQVTNAQGGVDASAFISTTGLAASLVVKNSASKLRQCYVYNNTGSQIFLCLYDANAVPADGAVNAKLVFPIANATGQIIPFPYKCASGIVLAGNANATPWSNKTATTANLFIAAEYE